MAISAIEKELVKATGVKASKYDERPLYLEAVFDAAQELPQEKWDNISQEARNWLAAFGDAFNANKDLPDFDDSSDEDASDEDEGEDEDASDEDEDGGEDEDGEGEDDDNSEDTVKTTKKTSAKKTAAKAEKTPAKKTAAKAEKAATKKAAKPAAKPEKATTKKTTKPAAKPRGSTDSARFVLGRIICKDPNAPVESLMTALEKAGHELSKVTVTTLRSDFRFLLRVMKAEGINPAKVEI